MEPIAEGSQGILVETLLEGMAEYYSAELSEKVIRGQTENALKGKCTGGTGTIGYKIDEEKFYRLDPLTAPLVLEAFQRYDNGDKMVEIVNFLNDKGVRNMQGEKMTHSSVNTMLKNRRYIGELSFRDVVVPDAIPAIVPKDLFDRVQKRMDKNKRAPACGKADEEYLLAISKQLYPEIARKYKATVGSVERDIRTVIRVCWENGYDQLQSYSLRPLYVRPTAGEFFDILVAYLSRSKPVLQAV